DIVEQRTLMRRIAFDGLDQVGNEIAAAAKLHVDAAPAFAHRVAGANQPVEHDYGVEAERGHHGNGNPFGAHDVRRDPNRKRRRCPGKWGGTLIGRLSRPAGSNGQSTCNPPEMIGPSHRFTSSATNLARYSGDR